jgi:gas vesicle protein
MKKDSSLYNVARAGINSLARQFALVFMVIFIIFLITGGYVSGSGLAVGFILGTLFIAIYQSRESLYSREFENATLPSVVMNPTISPVITVMANDQERSIQNLGGVVNTGDLSNISGSTLLSQVSGDVSNLISQLPSPTEPNEETDIKKLLTKLQDAIQSSEELNDDAKTDALEQVRSLAELVRNPNIEEKKSIARKAITFLMGTLALLPPAAKLVEACKSLIPMIGDWFSKL